MQFRCSARFRHEGRNMNLERSLLMLATVCLSSSLWANTTYNYKGSAYTSTVNFSACGIGPCANYALGGKITGQFTTASPLGPNLVHQNVLGSVTSYSFTDGINTYSSANTLARVFVFVVSTDSKGDITAFGITIYLWQTGTSPHAANDRSAGVALADFLSGADSAFNNFKCVQVGVAPSGVA